MARETRQVYCSPEGQAIGKKEFLELKEKSPKAWILKEYENHRLRAVLRVIEKPKTVGIPSAHWMIYDLTVHNILTDDGLGNPLPEPKYIHDPDASEQYRHKEEGINGYEIILDRYTDCELGHGSEPFIERGNLLSNDMPQVNKEVRNPELFGSW